MDDQHLTDNKYLLGRDNYTCQSCTKPELSLSDCHFQKIDSGKEWLTSNLVLLCSECFNAPIPASSRVILRVAQSFSGRLIVITGPMYSEKSTTTRSYFNKYKIALDKVIWIKPDSDIRAEGYSRTRNGDLIEAHTISARRPDQSLQHLMEFEMIAIDEVQFFSERILYVIHRLLQAGKIIIANGLKLKANRSFFGVMPYLLAEADEIVNLKSVCSVCQTIDAATRTKSINSNLPSESVGGLDKYYAICPRCDGGNDENEFVKSLRQDQSNV